MAKSVTANHSALYSVLSVDQKASDEEIAGAYRKASLKCHPDRPTGDKEEFKKVSAAYQVLSDPIRRKRYDETGDTEECQQERSVLTIITGILNEVIGSLVVSGKDPEKCHVIEAMRARVEQIISELETKIASGESHIAKIEKIAARFSVNRGEENLLAKITLSGVHNLEKQITADEERIARLKEAYSLISKYKYASDKSSDSQPFRFIFTTATACKGM